MELKSRDILSVNAIVITGILILLSIQSLGPPTLDDLNRDIKLHREELDSTRHIDELYENTKQALESLEKDPKNMSKQFEYEEALRLYHKILDVRFGLDEKLRKSEVTVATYQSLSVIQQMLLQPKIITGIMIWPFAVSSLCVLITSFVSPSKIELMTKVGALFSAVGFLTLLVVFVILFFTI